MVLQGLLPYYISPKDGQLLNNHITFGAMGDSYYEYLLKVWGRCYCTALADLPWVHRCYLDASGGLDKSFRPVAALGRCGC